LCPYTTLFRSAQAIEVVCVEDHGTRSARELLALQVSVDVRREVLFRQHCGEASLDRVERLDRPAVVVLPVRADEAFGEALQLPRIEFQRLRLVLSSEGARSGHRSVRRHDSDSFLGFLEINLTCRGASPALK